MSMLTTFIGMTIGDLITHLDKENRNYSIEIIQDNCPPMYFNKAGNYLVSTAALLSKIRKYEFSNDFSNDFLRIKVNI